MPYDNRMILIKDGGQVRQIPPDRVYFTFATGRFAYDCVTCKAQCCRGHGYLLNSADELQQQIGDRPGLALFVDHDLSTPPGMHRVRNCPPGCFFLTESHLCGIHRDHGYEAKPETCRLFPFNDFRLFGDHLVVRPAATLCPLAILPVNANSTLSGHEQLFESMSQKGISATVARCSASEGRAARIVARERHLVDLSEAHLKEGDYLAFTAAQLATTAGEAVAGIDWNSEVRRFTTEVCTLLSIPFMSTGDAAVSRILIAMTPYLRSRLILEDAPANPTPTAIAIAKVPYALLILYVIAEGARSVGMTNVTFQTVTRLLKDFLPVIVLLASLDQVVVWRHRAPVPVPILKSQNLRSRYVGIAKALLPSSQRKSPTRLGDLLRVHCPPEGIDGLPFLKDLARNLDGRITSVDDPTAWDGKRGVRTWVGSAVHRLALAHLSEEVLGTAYTRATVTSARKRGAK